MLNAILVEAEVSEDPRVESLSWVTCLKPFLCFGGVYKAHNEVGGSPCSLAAPATWLSFSTHLFGSLMKFICL
jgi:hypothetical protein